MTSKRGALRFPCAHHPLRYKTAYDEGQAKLINASTTGCVFEELSLPLAIRDRVLITIALGAEKAEFQARAVVARVEGNGAVAVHFTVVEPESQAQLRNYFSRLMRRR
jgi:hypothetical protein